MAFNLIMRRGLGSRNVPAGRPIILPFFFGNAGHGLIGSVNTAGQIGGYWSAEFSNEFGLGGTNSSAVVISKNLTGVSGAATTGSLTHRIGSLPTVSSSGQVGSFNIIAGPNRSIALRSAPAIGRIGSIMPNTPTVVTSVVATGRVGTLTRGSVRALTGVAGSGAIGTITNNVMLPNILLDSNNFTTANWAQNGDAAVSVTAATITNTGGFWDCFQGVVLTTGLQYTLTIVTSGVSFALGNQDATGAQIHGADNVGTLRWTATTDFNQVFVGNASGSDPGTVTVTSFSLVQG